jgi:hypothetical protein
MSLRNKLATDLPGVPGLAFTACFPITNCGINILTQACFEIPKTLEDQCPHHKGKGSDKPQHYATLLHEAKNYV